MQRLEFYRYYSHPDERRQFMERRIIKSTNPHGIGTWFTNQRFDDPNTAKSRLSLNSIPRYRVGPIPIDNIPDFNAIKLRVVAPAHNNPGGSLEACTSGTTYIFGLFDYNSNQFRV